MKTLPLSLALAAMLPAAGSAQPGQQVTVTAPVLTPAQANRFVQSVAWPSQEQLSRMNRPMCVAVAGFQPKAAGMVVDRMRENARGVGVALDTPGCNANVIVMVADDPDKMLADIRKNQSQWTRGVEPAFFRRMAASKSPVRAWVLESVRNEDGAGGSMPGDVKPTVKARSSSYLKPSSRVDIEASFVILPRAATSAATLAQVADYATMRALARTREATAAGGAATILSLYTLGAAASPPEMSRNDIAYLQALYRADPTERAFRLQRQIARRIAEIR